MRTALAVAGLEVELVVRSTAVEAVISRRYAPFLGAARAPLCSLVIEEEASPAGNAFAVMATAGRHFDLVLSGADLPVGADLAAGGRVRTAADPAPVDRALAVVFARLAADHGCVLLSGGGAIVGRSAHVYAGGSESWREALARRAGHRPLLSASCVAIWPVDGRWTAAATPFGPGPRSTPRQAPLAQLWIPAAGPFTRRAGLPGREQAAVTAAAVVPSRDPEVCARAERTVARLVNAVPCSDLPAVPPGRMWAEMGLRARPFPGNSPAELSLG